MFARLLSMTAFVSDRFETPGGADAATVPDVTDWLVPESVGQPLFPTASGSRPVDAEADDDEVTERLPVGRDWSLLVQAAAQA